MPFAYSESPSLLNVGFSETTRQTMMSVQPLPNAILPPHYTTISTIVLHSFSISQTTTMQRIIRHWSFINTTDTQQSISFSQQYPDNMLERPVLP